MTTEEQVADPRFRRGRPGVVLIDQWDDEVVDNTAWVEVLDPRSRYTSMAGVQDARSAVLRIEKLYPLEDRAEEERYECNGEQVWLAPDPEAEDYEENGDWPAVCPWVEVEDHSSPGALKFWVVKVVCPV